MAGLQTTGAIRGLARSTRIPQRKPGPVDEETPHPPLRLPETSPCAAYRPTKSAARRGNAPQTAIARHRCADHRTGMHVTTPSNGSPHTRLMITKAAAHARGILTSRRERLVVEPGEDVWLGRVAKAEENEQIAHQSARPSTSESQTTQLCMQWVFGGWQRSKFERREKAGVW